MLYKNIEELIGNTPMLEMGDMCERLGLCARIYAKLESFNLTGSVKDRAAVAMLDAAERSGAIKRGDTVIEPTSGNTGIGLAAVGVSRGYRVIIVMPDSMSEERRRLMTAYGAELVLTPGALGMQGAIDRAKLLSRELSGFIPSQFENPANAYAHTSTTAPEIYSDMNGNIDIFVAGVGTGGTISGVSKYLKERNPDILTVGVEPADSAVLSGGRAGAHKLQGIGAGFIPKLYDGSLVDRIEIVESEDAYATVSMLARECGLLVGISSGAAMSAAVRLASLEENKGKNIVVLLPDTGMRYLTTPDLF